MNSVKWPSIWIWVVSSNSKQRRRRLQQDKDRGHRHSSRHIPKSATQSSQLYCPSYGVSPLYCPRASSNGDRGSSPLAKEHGTIYKLIGDDSRGVVICKVHQHKLNGTSLGKDLTLFENIGVGYMQSFFSWIESKLRPASKSRSETCYAIKFTYWVRVSTNFWYSKEQYDVLDATSPELFHFLFTQACWYISRRLRWNKHHATSQWLTRTDVISRKCGGFLTSNSVPIPPSFRNWMKQ